MSDESEDTRYRAYFFQQVKKKNAERRAQDVADAAVEKIFYPTAVQLVLPVLFGKDWVGFSSEQEHVVLRIGEAHPGWHEHSSRAREREEQIARAERWLLVNGLIEERRGGGWVQTARLRKALANDGYLRDRIADGMAEEGDDRATRGAAKPEPAPKPARESKIHLAITAAYDAAAAAGDKPPNVNEIIGPVQAQLRAAGYEASGRQIRELAGADQHRKRRRKIGKTVASEKCQKTK
jgi:hypothetical protein